MRAQCHCGHRQRVTSAQCGQTIRCICGTQFEVPSLRQLKQQAADNLIAEIFDDPEFWAANGCFVCGENAGEQFRAYIELQPAIYSTVVVGPERGAIPILHTVVRTLFGPLAGFAILAADAATQKTERVLTQHEDGREISLQACRRCSRLDDVQSKLAEKLSLHKYFLEIKEDFPDVRVTAVSLLRQDGG